MKGPERHRFRSDVLHGATLQYAPANELGVVYLFADYARKHRLHVEVMRPGFPDCIAYQKTHRGEKEVKIEFEFRAKNFLTHRHPHKKCDWIVCWENNWPGAPENLRIIELRREYGLGFNVWLVPVGNDYKDVLEDTLQDLDDTGWSVPSLSHKNDLVLFYFTAPQKYIAAIYKLEGDAKLIKSAGWKKNSIYKKSSDYQAPFRRVAWLKCPLYLEEMQQHRILKNSGFIRACLRGRHNVTEFQNILFDLIIKRNPSLRKTLTKYL